MILLDAYTIVAYLADERPASDQVEPLLADSSVTTVNAAEVLDRLIRWHGIDPEDAELSVAQLGIRPIAVRWWLANEAGRLRAKHYHHRACAVSLADCIAAAAALTVPTIDALATADPALLSVVHAEGGRFIALPDSRGNVWSPTD